MLCICKTNLCKRVHRANIVLYLKIGLVVLQCIHVDVRCIYPLFNFLFCPVIMFHICCVLSEQARCNGVQTLTAQAGIVTDGSPSNLPYSIQSPLLWCSWIDQPGYAPIALNLSQIHLGTGGVLPGQDTSGGLVVITQVLGSGKDNGSLEGGYAEICSNLTPVQCLLLLLPILHPSAVPDVSP